MGRPARRPEKKRGRREIARTGRLILSRFAKLPTLRREMTIRWITLWRGGTLLAVAVVAGANVVHMIRKVPPAPVQVAAASFDPIAAVEARFARVRTSLKRHGVEGTIGFVGDRPVADDDYYYAQFALVPLVLDLDPAPHAWAVTNFRASAAAATIPDGWRVVEDTGAGVLLLRKSVP